MKKRLDTYTFYVVTYRVWEKKKKKKKEDL